MFQDVTIVLVTWLIMLLLQLVSAPFLYLLFQKKLIDGGWAFGRVLVWLLLSLIIWFGGHTGLPFNQDIYLYLVLSLAVLASSYYAATHWSNLKQYFQKRWLLILVEEWLFLLGFVFLIFIRAHRPDILDLEKFMDAGFIQAYLRSPTLPAEDMWLSGEKINYYTFGHFMGSIMTRLWGLRIEYGYNILLGLLMGLGLAEAFSVGANLVWPLIKDKGQKWVRLLRSGLIAAFLVIIGGNSHAAWYLLSNYTFRAYWYPDATRFIDRTIHEFPAYSFIVSDLHAHVWGLPLVLFLLINILVWINQIQAEASQEITGLKKLLKLKTVIRALPLGVLFGVMMMTSTWDFLIYGMLMVMLSLVLLVQDLKVWLKIILSGAVTIATALLVASPWLLNFVSISEGVKFAAEHSPFWQLLVLWSGHVTFSLVTLYFANRLISQSSDRQNQALKTPAMMIVALVLTALILIALPELIYFKDIYPNHPRANTMFKLTFQAFVMMGLAISWLAGVLHLKKFHQNLRVILRFLLGIFILAVGIYPYFGYRDYYDRLKKYRGLNGLYWMQQDLTHDYQLILWLRQNVTGRPVILEAAGDSYTKYARVSTFTGFPTVVGWKVHQWLWRGGYTVPQGRSDEVEQVYRQPLSATAQQILKKYQVKYIVVSSLERDKYSKIDESGLKQLGRIVYQTNQSYLVKLQNKI